MIALREEVGILRQGWGMNPGKASKKYGCLILDPETSGLACDAGNVAEQW